jgi:DNA (cytosine-5)-methyltransferase 1
MIRFGSLFAGIGGMDLGLERAGMQCAWQVEIDEFCRKVLAKHWPDVPKFNDVKECGKYNLELVDLICGGFPCQDISNAGKRAGINGERSGLWSEFHRIICDLRPRYVLVENVAALLARGLDRVLSDLATSGYDAEWSVLSACALGAPYTRERVFIYAYSQAQRPIQSTEGIQENRLSRESGRVARGEGLLRMDQSPVVGSRNGIPDYFHRNEALGNTVIPQVAEWIGQQIMKRDKGD